MSKKAKKNIRQLQLWPWLRTSFASIFSVVGGAGAISLLLNAFQFVRHDAESANNYGPLALYALQFVACLLMFLYSSFQHIPSHKLTRVSQVDKDDAVIMLWIWWPLLWFSWTLLYLVHSAQSWNRYKGLVDPSSYSRFLDVASQQLNGASAVFLLMLFHAMAQSRFRRSENSSLPPKLPFFGFFVGWAGLFVVIGVAEMLLLLFLDPRCLDNAVAEFCPFSWDELLRDFSFIYTAAVASATVLLVSRFGSARLQVPGWIFFPLIIYGAIQPLFGFVDHLLGDDIAVIATHLIQDFMITYALLGKVAIFIVVYWLADTGRLRIYMDSLSKTKRQRGNPGSKSPIEYWQAP